MASDWIKMRTDLYRIPKTSVIAGALMASTCAGIESPRLFGECRAGRRIS